MQKSEVVRKKANRDESERSEKIIKVQCSFLFFSENRIEISDSQNLAWIEKRKKDCLTSGPRE